MGNYNDTHVCYVASSASVGQTPDLIVLSAPGMSIKVTNISGAAPLFWSISHPGGAAGIPSVNGNTHTYVTAGAAGSSTNARYPGPGSAVVQAISTGVTSYLVEVQGNHATS